jgi:hypothetical protein
LRDFITPVAHVHAPQTSYAVQKSVAIGIIDVTTLGFGNYQGAGFLEGREICPRVDLMLLVFLANFFGVVLNIASASHDYSLLYNSQTNALT